MARISGHPQHAQQQAAPQPAQPSYDPVQGYASGNGYRNGQSGLDEPDGDSGRWFCSR